MRIFDRTVLCVFPLCPGLLFVAGSLTPTLIPRGEFVERVLGGLVMALGYLIERPGISL